ncbi:MAG: SurA N-terminal domain-containing protein [Spirochaetota bacterium]
MFESKSPMVRVGAYIIIGFFTLIIIISFGMPDFMTKLGMDDNVVAIIDGEKIYRLEFVRYRENMASQIPNADKKEMQDMILNNLIMRKLMLQNAHKIGVAVSDERVMNSIKNIFKDKSGKFSKEYLDRYLAHYHLGLPDFFLTVKEDLMLNEFRHLVFQGVGVSPEEVATEYRLENSHIQIKYCYLSTSDLNKRFKNSINVTEKEIDEELQKSKDEIKDPATDRKRIRDKIEKNKIAALKNDLINKIDKLAEGKKSFDEAASSLAGGIFVSGLFKLGDPVKEGGGKGKMLYSFSNSPIFNDNLLSLEAGRTSRAIDGFDGIYIFTPVSNALITREPSAKEYAKMEEELLEQKNNSVFMSIMSSIRDKAKITRNLKFN